MLVNCSGTASRPHGSKNPNRGGRRPANARLGCHTAQVTSNPVRSSPADAGSGRSLCQYPVIRHSASRHPPSMLSEPTQSPEGPMGPVLLIAISLPWVSRKMLSIKLPGISFQVRSNATGQAGPPQTVPVKVCERLPPAIPAINVKESPMEVGPGPGKPYHSAVPELVVSGKLSVARGY